jgi:xanthine dehydrogenase accessory factor
MEIVASILDALRSHPRIMLATIISTSGSTPAAALSKMIITHHGMNSAGTVGGGCMEGDVLAKARDLFPTGVSEIMTFHLNEDEMVQGLICGGTVKVLLEPVGRESLPMYEQLKRIRDEGEDCVVVTHMTPGGGIKLKSLVKADEAERTNAVMEYWEKTGRQRGDLAAQIQRALHRAETRIVALEDGQLILEPVFGLPQLVVFGGGHVSRYLSRTASMAGFRVTIVDDRPQYANAGRFPEADATLAVEFHHALTHITIKPSTYVVIATRGHRADEDVLRQVLRTPATYIGMIGSVRKVLTTYDHLMNDGVSSKDLTRVHAPMGLEIGAATAEEIAVSVVAEMIRVRRNAPHQVVSKSAAVLGRTIAPPKNERQA